MQLQVIQSCDHKVISRENKVEVVNAVRPAPVVRVVSRNLCPTAVEAWEQGGANGDALTARVHHIRLGGFIPVLLGTTYTLSGNTDYQTLMVSYNANKKRISGSNWITGSSTFTANGEYMRIFIRKPGDVPLTPADVLLAKPQLEVGSAATQFVEYREATVLANQHDIGSNISMLSDITLNGDEVNQEYYGLYNNMISWRSRGNVYPFGFVHDVDVVNQTANPALGDLVASFVSLPNTAVVEDIGGSLGGNTVQNLVNNGNFVTGMNEWSAYAASVNILSNVASITGNGAFAEPQIRQSSKSIGLGRQIYERVTARVTNSVCLRFGMIFMTAPYQRVSQESPVQNTWYTVSGIITTTAAYTGFSVHHVYTDTATANGKVMEVREVFAIDLTAMFGAGNEPAKEWCDTAFNFVDGIRDVGPIRLTSTEKNLFNPLAMPVPASAAVKTNLPNGLNVKNTNNGMWQYIKIPLLLKPNTNYYCKVWKVTVRSGASFVTGRDRNNEHLPNKSEGSDRFSFTTTDGIVWLQFYSTLGTAASGDVDYEDIMLSEGSVAVPYMPYTSTEVYLPTIGSRIPSGVADVVNVKGAKTQNVSDWTSLDSLWAALHQDYPGYKRIRWGAPSDMGGHPFMLDHTGKALQVTWAWDGGEQVAWGTPNLYVTISNEYSGWPDGFAPSSGNIQNYFRGWKMCNSDGTSPWLKNETPYTPATWAEWSKPTGVTGDSTGLTIPAKSSTVDVKIDTTLKSNTKYGALINIASNTLNGAFWFFRSNELGPSWPQTLELSAGSTGNFKHVTTTGTVTNNKFWSFVSSLATSGSITIKDVRVFELPAGSQIEADFNTLTADQLATKYPFYGLGTKYWKKITDGTGLTSTSPNASYAGYTPYKMRYPLTTPIISTVPTSSLLARPGGSIIAEPKVKFRAKPVAGVLTIPDTSWPIQTVEYVRKTDLTTVAPASNTTTTITLPAGYDANAEYEVVYAYPPELTAQPTLRLTYPTTRRTRIPGTTDITNILKVGDAQDGTDVTNQFSQRVKFANLVDLTPSAGAVHPAGYTIISLTKPVNMLASASTTTVTKATGEVLQATALTPNTANTVGVVGNNLIFAAANHDTGWPDSVTPTAAEVKAFLLGWTMCDASGNAPYPGSGTKYWHNSRNVITSVLPTSPTGWALPEVSYAASPTIVSDIIPLPTQQFSAKIKYMDARMTIFADYNCPRCRGTGWYINPIADGGVTTIAAGPMSVAQDFIKCLLTTPGSNRLDETFGAGLILDSGVHYFDNALEGVMRSAVRTAEDQCISMQTDRPDAPSDELLQSAELIDIYHDAANSSIYLIIELITVAGATLRFKFST